MRTTLLALFAVLSFPALSQPASPDLSGGARRGQASVFAPALAGRRMADGGRVELNSDSAASSALPLGTTARIRNLRNVRVAMVRVRDRLPPNGERLISVTPKVAQFLGMPLNGVAGWRSPRLRCRNPMAAYDLAPVPLCPAGGRRWCLRPVRPGQVSADHGAAPDFPLPGGSFISACELSLWHFHAASQDSLGLGGFSASGEPNRCPLRTPHTKSCQKCNFLCSTIRSTLS